MNNRANLLGKLRLILVMLILLVAPLSAQAQDVKSAVISLSQSAMADYDEFELEAADEKLSQATKLIESSTDSDPEFAKIYVSQAIVSYGLFKDAAPAIANERAYSAMLKALSYDPEVTIPDDYRTSDLESIMNKARKLFSNSSSGPVVLSTTKPVMEHTPLYELQRCEVAEVRARVPAHPDIYRVVVHYAPDSAQYEEIEMHPSASAADIFIAEIPGLATQGNELLYYIDAVNRSGEVIVNNATAASPNHVLMIGKCGGLSTSDIVTKYGDPLFQITLGLGTGFTFVSDADNTMCHSNDCFANGKGFRVDDVSGGGVLPFHLKISALFNLPAHIQLGIQLRGQIVNTQGTGGMAADYLEPWDSLSMGAEFRYYPLYKQPYRLYIGLGIGGGGANATLFLSNYDNYHDLYKFGYGYIAPEVGFLLTLHKYVGLAFELAIPIHFPQDPNVHFDLSIGPFFQI